MMASTTRATGPGTRGTISVDESRAERPSNSQDWPESTDCGGRAMSFQADLDNVEATTGGTHSDPSDTLRLTGRDS